MTKTELKNLKAILNSKKVKSGKTTLSDAIDMVKGR